MSSDNYKDRSAATIIISVIVVIIAITSFALWWHRGIVFPDTGNDTEEILISEELDKSQLDSTIEQLFSYNDMEVSGSELQDVSLDNSSVSLANDLTPVVNSNSSTAKVIVPIIDQNLLFIPAPSLVTIAMNGVAVPMLFIRANESTVVAYNPMTNNEVNYPFSTFSKSYDDAGRQCVFIVDRGYSGY